MLHCPSVLNYVAHDAKDLYERFFKLKKTFKQNFKKRYKRFYIYAA